MQTKKSILEFSFFKKKNVLKIICALCLICLLICLFFKLLLLNKKDIVLLLDDNSIECNNFLVPFKQKIKLSIENNTKNVKVYSLKWKNVENMVENQNKFLYKILCDGNNCQSISQSQVPITDFTLLSDIYIEAYQTQVYTITYEYVGNESPYSYFKGNLVVDEEITDKNKYEEYIKSREQKKEVINKLVKKYQNLDDK